MNNGDTPRITARSSDNPPPTRQTDLADHCRRSVLESYAPPAVLIDLQHKCLHFLGATDRFLHVAQGTPTHDLLAMTPAPLRTRLRSAIRQAVQDKARVVVGGCQVEHNGSIVPFDIEVRLAPNEGVNLLLVCFIEHSTRERRQQRPIDFQDMTALNNQLHETLERQRTTSNNLRNILYSTDVATLFLDSNLKIRFFTPATRSLFNIIPGDIDRPLADLQSLASDGLLAADARQVLSSLSPIEREIETGNNVWFTRRIYPYRAQDDEVEGVVITFTDVSDRKLIAKALEIAKHQAEQATIAKSRFLAAASHDLRQPLQTLVLIQGLLERLVEGEKARKLVARIDETLTAMSGMLNALLDINKIAAGTVRAEMVAFPINDLLDRLKSEFSYIAQAKRIELKVVPCSLVIESDPRLLEQMLRNLVSNALKYTRQGKIVLGCRRRNGEMRIEIWDTGVGIPAKELQAIFEEYHQVDNVARERSLGLGLGLSIVQRLADLLGAKVSVRSQPGKGSVFAVAIKSPSNYSKLSKPLGPHRAQPARTDKMRPTGKIFIVEDDPTVREFLEGFLQGEGYTTTAAPDGVAALTLVDGGLIQPDLLLADFNLPKGMNGLQLTAEFRRRLQRPVPFIILTGDISNETLREIAGQDGLQLNKPVKLQELTDAIVHLLSSVSPAIEPFRQKPSAILAAGPPVIFIVDDDNALRGTIRDVLEAAGQNVEDFADCEAFLAAYQPGREACLLIDAYLPGMSGLELLQQLRQSGDQLPAIMITGDSDVPMAVLAMKAGALDFIEKPVGSEDLLASVGRALEQSRDSGKRLAWRKDAAGHVADLTARERQIMTAVLAGHPSKNIAADLGISQRTVENHRASVMKKTGAKSLPALARLALAADWNGSGQSDP